MVQISKERTRKDATPLRLHKCNQCPVSAWTFQEVKLASYRRGTHYQHVICSRGQFFRLFTVSMVVSLCRWFVIRLLGDGSTKGAGWDRTHTEWISVAQTQLAHPPSTVQPVNRPSFILLGLCIKGSLHTAFGLFSSWRTGLAPLKHWAHVSTSRWHSDYILVLTWTGPLTLGGGRLTMDSIRLSLSRKISNDGTDYVPFLWMILSSM